MLLDASEIDAKTGTHRHSGATHISKITCPMMLGA
jgi:hypothetical protein